MDTVLHEMGVREDYVRVASGHLIKKSELSSNRPNQGRGRGSRGGCGRESGNRGGH